MFKNLFSRKKIEDNYKNDGILKSPLNGKILNLNEVPDKIFAGGILGEGIAIEPSEGLVCSPVSGEVIQVFMPSKHAVCIKSNDGIEILIHIGIDTVAMYGEGFEALVDAGDKVVVGQELIRFDLDKIKENAKSHITPVLVTNGYELNGIDILSSGQVSIGNEIIKVNK